MTHPTNKLHRNTITKLRWYARLKALGLFYKSDSKPYCYKAQGKPCSCYMCSPSKVLGKEAQKAKYRNNKHKLDLTRINHI